MKCLVSIFDKTECQFSSLCLLLPLINDQYKYAHYQFKSLSKVLESKIRIQFYRFCWSESSQVDIWQVPFLLFSCDFNSWAEKERTAQQVVSAELRQLSYWVLKNTCFAAFAKEIKSKFKKQIGMYLVSSEFPSEETEKTQTRHA